MLKWQEAGMATVDVCRCYGNSSASFFYQWKAKFGGLGPIFGVSAHQTRARS